LGFGSFVGVEGAADGFGEGFGEVSGAADVDREVVFFGSAG
jgi:hypothetical protein